MKQTTVVYATFDGIATMQHGIGTQARAFISAVSDTALPAGTDVALAFPRPVAPCAGYPWSDEIHHSTQQLCAAAGIQLVQLPFAEPVLWSQSAWVAICLALIETVRDLRRAGRRVVVLAVDAVFTPLSMLALAEFGRDSEVEIVHVLYSSARMVGAAEDPVREAWEQIAVATSNSHSRVRITDIGASFTRHLRDAYGLASDPLPFRQSVALTDPELMPYGDAEAGNILKEAGIPTDRPLIVAAARSDPIKGLHDLADSLALVSADVLFVIIAVPYHAHDPHLLALNDHLAWSGRDHVLVTHFDRSLLRALASADSTCAFVVPSRGEPVGMAPQEVAMWARVAGPVVAASNCDGLAEQIDHGRDGFLFAPGDAVEIARTIDHLVALPADERARVRARLWERVVRERDFVENLGALLRALNIETRRRPRVGKKEEGVLA